MQKQLYPNEMRELLKKKVLTTLTVDGIRPENINFSKQR